MDEQHIAVIKKMMQLMPDIPVTSGMHCKDHSTLHQISTKYPSDLPSEVFDMIQAIIDNDGVKEDDVLVQVISGNKSDPLIGLKDLFKKRQDGGPIWFSPILDLTDVEGNVVVNKLWGMPLRLSGVFMDSGKDVIGLALSDTCQVLEMDSKEISGEVVARIDSKYKENKIAALTSLIEAGASYSRAQSRNICAILKDGTTLFLNSKNGRAPLLTVNGVLGSWVEPLRFLVTHECLWPQENSPYNQAIATVDFSQEETDNFPSEKLYHSVEKYGVKIEIKVCPRCNDQLIPCDERAGEYPGAISRWDNKTEICSRCGEEEAFEQLGIYSTESSETLVERLTDVIDPLIGTRQWVYSPGSED